MDIQRLIRYALSLLLTAVFLLHVGNVIHIPILTNLENQSYDLIDMRQAVASCEVRFFLAFDSGSRLFGLCSKRAVSGQFVDDAIRAISGVD